MILRGVLVQALSQQDDRSDTGPLDPATVLFEPDDYYPVTIGFDVNRLVGKAKISRSPEGAIVAEIEVPEQCEAEVKDFAPPFYLAFGGSVTRDQENRPTTTLISASIVKKHADHAQPPLEIPE